MRIIGGVARGRQLEAPRGRSTRPTSDRVREAMFNVVGSALGSLEGLEVLDLFAGSGALGLEAISRGAAAVIAVDHDVTCQRVIRRNAQRLGFSAQCTVLGISVQEALQRLPRQGRCFDLALLDPPYAEDPSPLLESLDEAALVEPEGLIVLEHGRSRSPPDQCGRWRLFKRKGYGDSALAFFTGQP